MMTDSEFEKMIAEKRIWESKALVLYTDSNLIKPEKLPYLTSAYYTYSAIAVVFGIISALSGL